MDYWQWLTPAATCCAAGERSRRVSQAAAAALCLQLLRELPGGLVPAQEHAGLKRALRIPGAASSYVAGLVLKKLPPQAQRKPHPCTMVPVSCMQARMHAKLYMHGLTQSQRHGVHRSRTQVTGRESDACRSAPGALHAAGALRGAVSRAGRDSGGACDSDRQRTGANWDS